MKFVSMDTINDLIMCTPPHLKPGEVFIFIFMNENRCPLTPACLECTYYQYFI